MGEMDNNLLQFFYNGKPVRQGYFDCGTIPKPSPTHTERMSSLKAEVDAMAEKYKPIVDELMREINESFQREIELFSGETTLQIGKDFPMAFTKRKARKHYKPKFTL